MSSLEEIAKAKAKITKLLNMTVENGCSEDEQETAMAMAAAIATRLGIDLEAQRQHEATPASVRQSSAPSTKSSRCTRFLRSRQQPSCMGATLHLR
jgi:folylpolyglutamate synthase/dihydropteroate synthase